MFRNSWGLGAIALCAVACDVRGNAQQWQVTDDVPPFSGEAGASFGGTSMAAGGSVGLGGGAAFAQPSLPGAVFTSSKLQAPISGGTLLISKDGGTAVVAEPDRDRVYVIDVGGVELKHDIALPAGSEPGRSVEDASGHVHLVLRGSGKLVSLDITSGKILATRDVCRYPRGVAVSDADRQLHVACAEGQLVTLSTDVSETEPVRSLMLDRDLRDVVPAKDGLWVSRFRSAEILRLNAAGEITRRVMLPTAAVTSGLSVPSVAWRMIASGNGGVMVVHQRAFAGEVIPSPGGYGGPGGPGDGIVQTAVSTVDDDNPPRSTSVALSAPLPVDLAESSTGQLLIGTAALEHPLSPVFPERTPLLTKDTLGFSEAPIISGFAFSEPSAFMSSLPSTQIVAVGFAANTPVLQLAHGTLVIGERGLVLPGDDDADTGNDLFHLRTGSGIACASCHPEGREDGHTWNFAGFGARRTQSLRGGLIGTEPLHWDGTESDFTALTRDVMQGRMAGPELTGAQISALSRYVDRFPALPSSLTAPSPSIDRGKQLFEDSKVGCTTCHSGARFSNDKTLDVGGSSGALQVPSLVGLWARAPYLHDGCAQTIGERFTTCDTGQHGDLSGLSSDDLGALSAYLETL
jgi:hypothetical protein